MIFLDVIMPEADGGTIAAQIKEEPALRNVPIVFLIAVRVVDRTLKKYEWKTACKEKAP